MTKFDKLAQGIGQLLLSDTVRSCPIDDLHLGARVTDILNAMGISTIGDLVAPPDENRMKVVNILSRTDVRKTLTIFYGCLSETGDADWYEFWRSTGIQVIPETDAEELLGRQPLDKVIATVKAILQHEFAGSDPERAWTILRHRFKLEGAKKYTLHELGDACDGITRQRINQIETKALVAVRQALIARKYAKKRYQIHPDVLKTTRTFCDLLELAPNQAMIESDLLDSAAQIAGTAVSKIESTLLFLLNAAGFDRIDFDDPLKPIWGKWGAAQRNLVKGYVPRIHRLFTVTNPLPIGKFDLLMNLNKGARGIENLTMTELQYLIPLCNSVEVNENQEVQAKFRYLDGRGNQVERLLTETSQPMTVHALTREINHQSARYGGTKV